MSWRRISNITLSQITCKGTSGSVAGCYEVSQAIYQKNSNDTFKHLPGAGVWAAAGADYSIWSCNSAKEIYRWKDGWTKVDGAWGCVQVDGWDFGRAVYVNDKQELWEYKDNSSHRLDNGFGTHITIGVNGEKWHVNKNGAIYRMLPSENNWKSFPGPGGLKSIHCTSSEGNLVAGVSVDGNLYRLNGAGWTKLNGTGTHIAITQGNMWHVNKAGEVYQASI